MEGARSRCDKGEEPQPLGTMTEKEFYVIYAVRSCYLRSAYGSNFGEKD